VDQFVETSVPRKGIRDVNKSRLILMSCLPLASGPGVLAAAEMPVPAPLQECDLLRVVGLTDLRQQVRCPTSQIHMFL
jgi:hypothetical protein